MKTVIVLIGRDKIEVVVPAEAQDPVRPCVVLRVEEVEVAHRKEVISWIQ